MHPLSSQARTEQITTDFFWRSPTFPPALPPHIHHNLISGVCERLALAIDTSDSQAYQYYLSRLPTRVVRIRESTRYYPLEWYVSRLGFKDFHGSEMPFVFGNPVYSPAKSDLHPMSSRFLTTCKRIGARLLTVGLRLALGCRCGSGSQVCCNSTPHGAFSHGPRTRET